MYNPQRFKSSDTNEAFELMDRNPFATVITVVDGKPQVSQLPLTPKKVGDKVELIGHLARANPQWKSFVNTSVTVLFHGPHTYITPKWYAENDVPTWNYASIQVTGKIELIETQDGIIECLKELTSHVERHWPSGWEFFIPDDLQGEILPKSIVGFKITVDEISFKKKLSQNRSPADRAGVLIGLSNRLDDNSTQVLQKMLDLYLPSGEPRNQDLRVDRLTALGVITKEAFDGQLETFINNVWGLQDRLGELTEFEGQWEALFSQLKNKTGIDCSVHIHNHSVYKTFHWDKYQIILSDLISLIENELDSKNKKSVFKQTIHHLKLQELEDYVRHDIKVNFSFYPHREISEEEKATETERSKLSGANDTYTAIKSSLYALYPNIKEDFVIRGSDLKDLLTTVQNITKDLKSARNLFNHKLEESAKKRHTKGLEAAGLANIRKATDDVFRLVREVGMVFKQTSYASYNQGYGGDICDQIDIILFGSTQRAVGMIYEKQDKQMLYHDARKKFYESDEVLDFVSNLTPEQIQQRQEKYL